MLYLMGAANDHVGRRDVRQEASAGNSAVNSFEDPEFGAQAIAVALEILLTALDQCRTLLDYSVSAGPLVPHGQAISTREVKELDHVVDMFLEELNERINFEVEQARESDPIDDKLIYPFALESAGAILGVVFHKLQRELALKYFSKYHGDSIKEHYIVTRMRLGRNGEAESLLGAALVPLLVSKIEDFVGALVRTGLSLYPNALGQAINIPDEIFQRYQANISTADIRRWQIDQKVADFLKGSPQDWQRSIQRWSDIDITNIGVDWDLLGEVIQRRHVIIHNSGRVDTQYLHSVASHLLHGLWLGSILVSNSFYVYPVLVEIETWAICLAFRWNKKFFGGRGKYPMLIARVTDLEDSGRWSHALAILDTILLDPLPPDLSFIAYARINRWFCQQELGRDTEGLKREIETWDPVGLNSDSPDRKTVEIGRFALLRNYPQLVDAIREATTGQRAYIQKRSLREMPLIKRAMRESNAVKAILLMKERMPQGPPPRRRAKKGRSRR
jgi:hypothetical protein